MREVVTKVVGVSFGKRQEYVKELEPGQRLFWKHESDNEYDANAIAVYSDEEMQKQIGHLKREMAATVVGWISEGKRITIFVEKVTGGIGKMSYGVNIRLVVEDGET